MYCCCCLQVFVRAQFASRAADYRYPPTAATLYSVGNTRCACLINQLFEYITLVIYFTMTT